MKTTEITMTALGAARVLSARSRPDAAVDRAVTGERVGGIVPGLRQFGEVAWRAASR